MTSATETYRAARDLLLELREDPARAHAEFRWPDVGRHLQLGRRLVRRDRPRQRPARAGDRRGGRPRRPSASFDEMARRSDQVAAWLAGHGVRQGDAVIVMLGNQVELWETMLAIMKLGAVIMPTTHRRRARPTCRPDRPRRRRLRGLQPGGRPKFDDGAGRLRRLTVGAVDGWASCTTRTPSPYRRAAHPGTAPGDRLLLYFTSGTTSGPSSSSTPRCPTRSGTSRRCTGSGCARATCT